MSNNHFQKKHVLIISSAPHLLIEIKIELLPAFDVSIAATSSAALTAMEIHDVAAIVICIGENCDHCGK